jgi:ankyrin repeat protein
MSDEANNLLLESAMENDLKGVKKALKVGADLNAIKEWEGTALHIVSSRGFLEIAEFLLEAGADKAKLAGADFTPLHLAARDGQVAIVKLLLEKGDPYTDRILSDVSNVASMSTTSHPAIPDIIRRQRIKQLKPEAEDHSEEDQQLFKAVYNGDLKNIEQALENGADINAKDDRDLSVLRWAVRRHHLKVVEFLLEKGVKINDVSNMGWTALMEASMHGLADIVKVLIAKKADVNIRTTVDGTALYFASYEGFIEVVKLLLDAGADPTVKVDTSTFDYEEYETALSVAQQQGHSEIVKLLEKTMKQ